jgi:hypothetical protein
MTVEGYCTIIGSFFGSLFLFIIGLIFICGIFGVSFDSEKNVNLHIHFHDDGEEE